MAQLSLLCPSLFELQFVGDGDRDRGIGRCEINLPAWGEGPGPLYKVQGSGRSVHAPGQSSPLLPHLVQRALVEGAWRVEDGGWKIIES